MDFLINMGISGVLIVVTVGPYVIWMRRRDQRTREAFEKSEKSGLNEPPSLHPVIAPERCIGSSACVSACPEKEVLGLVDGRARLVHASRCIGHSRCYDACPVGAISLVFGTAKRGMDIPHVSAHFETNVPGIYIAGELGGMGLIRNAVTQGKQAIQQIAKAGQRGQGDVLDVIVVGAGPAGIAASLAAMEAGLRFVTVDQAEIGGAVRHYPRRKLVMTQPMDMPLYGKVRTREMFKEDLIALFEDVVVKTGLEVQTQRKVENLAQNDGVFEVHTTREIFRAKQVVLAIGRRGTPRKLGVPGEEQNKVAYSLLEPEQFQDMDLLVVGGGDSALEAACSLAEEPGNRVTLSYRREQFQRPKEDVRDRVSRLIEAGKIETVFSSNVQCIEESSVLIEASGVTREWANDHVFVFAGGELPTGFLKQIGVSVDTKYGKN